MRKFKNKIEDNNVEVKFLYSLSNRQKKFFIDISRNF